MNHSETVAGLREWVGRTITEQDELALFPARGMAALLDREPNAFQNGSLCVSGCTDARSGAKGTTHLRRISELLGRLLGPAVTSAISASGTWQVELPRNWRTASMTCVMPRR